MFNKMLALCILVLATWGHSLPAVTDSLWEALNPHNPVGKYGVVGTVYASAYDKAHGILYIGGNFKMVAGKSIAWVAQWDGKEWKALENGPDSVVRALQLDKSGKLYAGGDFFLAGGSTANHIAKWDGSQWTQLGSGLNDGVYSLALDSAGVLYAGGIFTRSGGTSMTGMAQWNGSQWSPMGQGMASGQAVRALAYAQGVGLYAGGSFTSADGLSTIKYLALWDGTKWNAVGDALNNTVYAISVDTNGVFVGGSFTKVGTSYISRLARWDSKSWKSVGSGTSGTVYSLAMDSLGGNLFVGGSFSDLYSNLNGKAIAKWNRSRWELLDSGLQYSASNYSEGQVNALSVLPGSRLFAAGYFGGSNGMELGNMAIWTGRIWWDLGEGPSGKVEVVRADKLGNVWIAGDFGSVGDKKAGYIAKWNGTAWDTLAGGFKKFTEVVGSSSVIYTPRIYDLLPDNQGGVYACGILGATEGDTVHDVAHWNGSKWVAMGSGMGHNCNSLTLDLDGRLVAGGAFTKADGAAAKYVARWMGTYWENMGAGVPMSVNALLTDTSTGLIYAAGSGSRIYTWDGSVWTALSDTVGYMTGTSTPYIYGLAVADTFLYVSGNFNRVGAVDNCYGLGRMGKTGVGASKLGTSYNYGLSNSIGGDLVYDGSKGVYVTGSFTTAGGSPSRGIAHFNGENWVGLGSALDSSSGSVALDRDGDLWVGGKFSKAGGKHSPFFARLKHFGGAQRIVTTGLSQLTYGDAPVKVLSSSTLPVVLTSSDPTVVSVSNDTLYVHKVGSAGITANQAGDALWDAAPQAQWVLEVKPKTVTIANLYGAMHVYDGTDTVSTTGTPRLVGVLAADEAGVSLSGKGHGKISNVHVGNRSFQVEGYSLAGSMADQYVLEQPVLISRVITAMATVTPVDTFRVVGEANPDFKWTVTGLVAGDLDTAIHDVTLSCAATPSSPAGSYTIEGSGGTARDYDVFFAFGKLTVLSSSSSGGSSSSSSVSSSSSTGSSSSVSSSSGSTGSSSSVSSSSGTSSSSSSISSSSAGSSSSVSSSSSTGSSSSVSSSGSTGSSSSVSSSSSSEASSSSVSSSSSASTGLVNHPVDGSGLLYEAKTKMLTLTSEGTSFIQVYSITGNLVKSSEKRSLSLSDLRAGVYVVQARINQRKTSLYITLD